MKVYLAVWVLCTIAAIVTAAPYNDTRLGRDNSKAQPQSSTPTAASKNQNDKPSAESIKADSYTPKWYTPLERPEWLTVIIATFALLVIGWQSWETRKAAEASQKSVETAAQNIELYISKERARLRIEMKPLAFPSQADPAYNTVDFNVAIYGPTDAFVTESLCVAYFYPWQVIDNPDLANLAMLPIHSLTSVIRANSPPIECYAFLNIDASSTNDNVTIAEIKAKRLAVGIRGFIKYRDVFGRDRETAFRYVWRYSDAMYGLGEEFGDWIKRGNLEENRET